MTIIISIIYIYDNNIPIIYKQCNHWYIANMYIASGHSNSKLSYRVYHYWCTAFVNMLDIILGLSIYVQLFFVFVFFLIVKYIIIIISIISPLVNASLLMDDDIII